MINFKKISSSLGSIIENNSVIENEVNWSAKEIYNKIGIKRRYISNPQEDCLSLAEKAIRNLNEASLLKRVKFLISVSNTGNNNFPGISNKIISKFDFSENILCINLNSGCTGFVDALSIVDSLMKKNELSLIINVDTYSKYIKKNDRGIRTLFSDGASASLIENIKDGYKISKKSFISKKNTDKFLQMNEGQITMNGPMVLNFVIKDVIEQIKKILNKDPDYIIICHQPGKVVIELIKKSFPNNKIFTNYENKGNLVSASIPILIQENFNEIFENNKIILIGFGVGLSSSILKLIRSN